MHVEGFHEARLKLGQVKARLRYVREHLKAINKLSFTSAIVEA